MKGKVRFTKCSRSVIRDVYYQDVLCIRDISYIGVNFFYRILLFPNYFSEAPKLISIYEELNFLLFLIETRQSKVMVLPVHDPTLVFKISVYLYILSSFAKSTLVKLK